MELKIDFNKLHKVCTQLNELYIENSHKDEYIDYDFSLLNLNYDIPYCYDVEDFIGYISFSFNNIHNCIVIAGNTGSLNQYNDLDFMEWDTQYIPIELLDKNEEEIEEWYFNKIEELKVKQLKNYEEELKKLKFDINQKTKDIERLKNKLKSLK